MIEWPDRNSKRQPWTPAHLDIQDFTYSFDSYGKKNSRYAYYRCIHGSRSSLNKCTAKLKVEFSQDMKHFRYLLISEHTCLNNNFTKNPYYSETQIRSKIAELYNDPQYSHYPEPIFNALLNWVNTTTPIGETKNSIPLSMVRSCVRSLSNIYPKNKLTFDNCLGNSFWLQPNLVNFDSK